jgi:antitoxin HigA-1
MSSEPSGDAPPPHPGSLLRDDVLPRLGLSVSRASRELGVARQTLHRLLAGTMAVSPGMAVRLARLSGIPASRWLGRQQAHDLWHAEHALADLVRRIPAHVLPDPFRPEAGTASDG